MGRVGLEHGLDACVNVNTANVSPPSSAMIATTVEALIGGAFLDGGLEAARKVMRALDLLENDETVTVVMLKPFVIPI